jgi:hypothetical protein
VNNDQHPCIECAWYIKPSLFMRIFFPGLMFNERCGHHRARDKVDGKPMPCVTVRISECDGREGTLFQASSNAKEGVKND